MNAAISYLNLMEEKLTPLVEDDLNSKIGDAEAHFSALRAWLMDRADNVQDQISANCRWVDWLVLEGERRPISI